MSIEKATQTLKANIAASAELMGRLDQFGPSLAQAVSVVHEAIKSGHKLLSCGNGGSAADSAHFSAEIAGRYVIERRGYPAIDLSSNASLVTALSNDYPPAEVFARQVVAFGAAGDVMAVFTTSGNSENVLLALEAAKNVGISTIAFLGRDGGRCKGQADVEFIVPCEITARIQEAHELLYHSLCELLDPLLGLIRVPHDLECSQSP